MAVIISSIKYDYTELNFSKFRNPNGQEHDRFPTETETVNLADAGYVDSGYDKVYTQTFNSNLAAYKQAGVVTTGLSLSGTKLGTSFTGNALVGATIAFAFTEFNRADIIGSTLFFDFDRSFEANALLSVMKTTSTADDISFVSTLLANSDLILLSEFNDKARGYNGDDIMRGYAGADTLYGDAGVDKIMGGTGRDHLYGGIGADDFIFNRGDSGNSTTTRDVIYDFYAGSDDLDLSLIDANSKSTVDNKFDFGGTRAGANDVWFARSGGNVIVYGDTNGDARADFEIELRGVSNLSAGDFIL